MQFAHLSIAVGLFLLAGAAAGQTRATTPGALSGTVPNDASNPSPTASTATDAVAAPERLVTVLPRYPRDAPRGTAGTVSVTFSLDASGRPFNVRPAPEHDIIGLRALDGVLTAAPEPGQDFRAAAVDAVSQGVYATPRQDNITLLVQFSFLAEKRVRLGTQRVMAPVHPRLEPLVAGPRSTAR